MVSGLLYPFLISFILYITYLFKWFTINSLIFSFIGCDFVVVFLLFIKTELSIRFYNKIEERTKLDPSINLIE